MNIEKSFRFQGEFELVRSVSLNFIITYFFSSDRWWYGKTVMAKCRNLQQEVLLNENEIDIWYDEANSWFCIDQSVSANSMETVLSLENEAT